MARISIKAIESVKAAAKNQIERNYDAVENKLRSKRNSILDLVKMDFAAFIQQSINDSFIYRNPVVEDIEYKAWNNKLRVVLFFDKVESDFIPDVAAIDNERKEHCKEKKLLLNMLDDWEIECIKDGEIKELPKIPEALPPEISCYISE